MREQGRKDCIPHVRGRAGLGDKAYHVRPFHADSLIKLQNAPDLCNIIHRTPGQRVGGAASVVTASGRGVMTHSRSARKPRNLERRMGSASDTGIIYTRGKACCYPEKFRFQVRGVKILPLYPIN